MILTLTEAERQIALGISVAVALGGLVLAAAGTQTRWKFTGG
jgi:cytochrome c oxidase cbb3-type subunit 1